MSEQKVFRFVVPHQPQANGCLVCSSYVLIWVLGCTLGSPSNTTLQIFSANSAHWVGFFNIGSGWVLEKIPGSGSGSGRVGMLRYRIGYFRVSFLLSGISGYSWVFSDMSRYFQVFLGILDMISFFSVTRRSRSHRSYSLTHSLIISWLDWCDSGERGCRTQFFANVVF